MTTVPSTQELAKHVLEEGFIDPADLSTATLEQIGRYRILELLGEGAAGEVYRAVDTVIQREVAIKLIKRGPSEARLKRELHVLASLDHEGVVAIYDAGVEMGRSFFVMAYAGGTSLAQAELSVRRWVEVLVEVLEACEYVHSKGVVHRDLKPENIILDAAGSPAIADFGIAKLLETDERLTLTGAMVGTPLYMAPEQLSGTDVGPRADIYAAGAMLYERLCGRLPFEGNTLMEFVARITGDEPAPSPREHDPDVPPLLAEIAMRAISRDPSERFPSAVDMAHALRAWLEAGVRPEPTQRHQTAAVVAAILLLAGGLGAALALLPSAPNRGGGAAVSESSKGSQPPPPASTPPLATASPTPRESKPAPSPTPTPAATPLEPKPAPSPRPTSAASALSKWLAKPPARDQLAQAFGDLAAELSAPTGEDAQRFARVCWATALSAVDEDWASPGALLGLRQLSQISGTGRAAELVRGNAWGLRWWFERDAQGQTQGSFFDAAGTPLAGGMRGGQWEANASAAVLYVLAVSKNTGREFRLRFVKRKAQEALGRLRRLAPPEERALVADLERRLQ